jgi:hypothetical protein
MSTRHPKAIEVKETIMNAITSTTTQTQAQAVTPRRIVIVFAYLGILIAVPVFGFWRAFAPGDAITLLWVQSGLLVALFALTFVWRSVRALRGFFLIALAMGLLPALATALIVNTALGTSQAGALVWKSIVMLAMGGLLLAMGLKRREFFLVKGDLDAPSKHSRLLPGMKTDETWKRSGRNITIGLFLVATILLIGLNLPRLGLDNGSGRCHCCRRLAVCGRERASTRSLTFVRPCLNWCLWLAVATYC